MKKATVLIYASIFVVVTVLLGINKDKMYQKKVHFENSNEIIEQLKTKSIKAADENGKMAETNDFKECLSQRKRLTYSDFNFEKIQIEKTEELNDGQKKAILKNYDTLRKEFSKRREITKEEAIRLDANTSNVYYDNGKRMYSEPRKIKIDLVLIDEGEGLVIDYIMTYSQNEEEGKKDA